jgi:isopentenyldiphosphate isomerase
MMEERVIKLDSDDNVIGSATKKESHLLDKSGKSMLHRAFSVFLFSPDGTKLLLQKRADEKESHLPTTLFLHPDHHPHPRSPFRRTGRIRAARTHSSTCPGSRTAPTG